jgi:hypothetical protein
MSGPYCSSRSPMEQDYLVGEVVLNKLETLFASHITPSKGIRPLRVQASDLHILLT